MSVDDSDTEGPDASGETYELVDPDQADHQRSGKSETEHVDLTEKLDLAEMRARVWYMEPGHDRKGTHVHERQEELYYAIEGPGRMTIAGETIEVPEGAFVRLPPETPRRLFNDTDEEHVWLIVGAPPVRDDGHQLNRQQDR
ncbi:MAG: cupin domain-containing protein [Halanaeroarchaeum sp.]